jgi:hypothetical protein
MVMLASIGGTVISRRTERLRHAYSAARLLEEQGLLVNEIRWQKVRHTTLSQPARLLPEAERQGFRLSRDSERVRFVEKRILHEGHGE